MDGSPLNNSARVTLLCIKIRLGSREQTRKAIEWSMRKGEGQGAEEGCDYVSHGSYEEDWQVIVCWVWKTYRKHEWRLGEGTVVFFFYYPRICGREQMRGAGNTELGCSSRRRVPIPRAVNAGQSLDPSKLRWIPKLRSISTGDW